MPRLAARVGVGGWVGEASLMTSVVAPPLLPALHGRNPGAQAKAHPGACEWGAQGGLGWAMPRLAAKGAGAGGCGWARRGAAGKRGGRNGSGPSPSETLQPTCLGKSGDE